MLRVFLGYDPREQDAYDIAVRSLEATARDPVKIEQLKLKALQDMGLYQRPVERRDGRLWDPISEAPMSTEHALTRFFVPVLADFEGWALFADCDILLRRDISELFALADDRYAVQVVQHDYTPTTDTKMDGQVQTAYPRKLWSSVILWNCAHPAHQALPGILNTLPGRDLHRFCWLQDDEIGSLPLAWNYLVGISPPYRREAIGLVHFTLGIPSMAGYSACDFADEWWAYVDAA